MPKRAEYEGLEQRDDLTTDEDDSPTLFQRIRDWNMRFSGYSETSPARLPWQLWLPFAISVLWIVISIFFDL